MYTLCIHVCIKRGGPTTTIYINNHEPWLYVTINMDIIYLCAVHPRTSCLMFPAASALFTPNKKQWITRCTMDINAGCAPEGLPRNILWKGISGLNTNRI